MPHKAADRIRNVALIGHRGSGKTSLHEAMLYEAGAVNRLGTVESGPATGKVVAIRQGNLLATSFLPEVTGDRRVHEYFTSMVRAARA